MKKFFKRLTLGLAAVFSLGALAGCSMLPDFNFPWGNNQTEDPYVPGPGPDTSDFTPVLRFVVASDMHVSANNPDSQMTKDRFKDMFTQMNAYADALGEQYTVCLDVGHAGLTNETADKMIRAIGKKRLGALHIHDNDFYHDSHTAPFYGKMNWDEITSALADINYDESFTFEVESAFWTPIKELRLPAAKYLHAIGSYLVSEIERKKKGK